MIAISLACFGLLWLLLRRFGERVGFVLASIAWALWLVAATEILSIFDALRFAPVAGAWLVALVGLGAAAWLVRPTLPRISCPGVLVWIAAGVVVLLAAVALVTPPNNYDAMTYHMPRVMHWAQNETLRTYATNNARQIHLSPGAEYVILHFQILSGGDRFAHLPQWFALLGSMIGVSLIARGIGATPRGQIYSAAAVLAVPMAIAQATSAQNDLVAAHWVVCFAAAGLELRRTGKPIFVAAVGCAFGLALLTKATSYVVAPPLAILFLLPAPTLRRVAEGAIALALALVVNAGFFARNYAACGSPIGPGVETVEGVTTRYTNEEITPTLVASNVLRNASLQLMTPWDGANDELLAWVRLAHVQAGILPSDRRITIYGTRYNFITMPFDEDTASAPLFMLALIAAVCAIGTFRGAGWRGVLGYAALVCASYVAFCAVLKWQPWNARLHLPLLLLATPIVGIAIARYVRPALQLAAVLILISAALPSIFANKHKPLLSRANVFTMDREDLYFIGNPKLQEKCERLAAADADAIGLTIGHDGWEYPIWIYAAKRPGVEIRHVGVTNYTARFGQPFAPEVVVRAAKENQIAFGGVAGGEIAAIEKEGAE